MTIGETLFSNTLKMFSRHVVESEESDVAASDEVFPRYRNVITARDVTSPLEGITSNKKEKKTCNII